MGGKKKADLCNMKIRGHELVTVREKESDADEAKFHEVDRLKVKMHGVGDDEKARLTIYVDPDDLGEWPIGDVVEMELTIRQTRDPVLSGAQPSRSAH